MKLPFFGTKDTSSRNNDFRKQMEMLINVNSAISSSLQLDEILQVTVNEMVRTMGYFGGVIFLVDQEQKVLRSRTVSETWYTKIALKFIKSPFASLFVELDPASKNLAVQTVLQKKKFISPKLSDFVVPAVDESLANTLQKVTGHKSGITIPLLFGDECLGVIMFTKKVEDDFEADMEIIEAFSKQVSIAIRNSTLFTQVTQQVQQLGLQNAELTSLNSLTGNIISVLNVDDVLQRTSDGIPKELGYLGVVVALLNQEKTELKVAAVSNNDLTNAALALLGKDKSEFPVLMNDEKYQHVLSVQAIKQNKVLLSDDFNAAFSPPLPQALVSNIVRVLGAQSVATLPLKSSNGVIGAVGFLLGKKSADIGQSSIGFMEAFTHVLGIALDNSQSFAEKERLLNDLQQKIVELEEAYRTEKDMITILAHELRTPISTASNAFQVLSTAIQPVPEKMDEAKFSQYTTIVSSQLKRLAEIVKTFMSGSETDNAKIQLNIEDVNLNEVCETAHSNFATEAGKKGLTLNKEILLNTLSVKADKNRLLEIVDNLLSNAIKYTATGGQVTVKTIVGEGGFNGISVEDTGEGIPAEDIPNLGKKYYRVNQHIQDKENALQQFTRPGGTGLGLYVSFGLAKRMGGSIQVESEVGKGSKFTLWLPKSNSNSNSQSGSINTELTSTG